MAAEKNTLLAAMWEADGDADAILARLENGDLQLTGNFKGRESEVVSDAREPGDWEKVEK